MQWWGHMVGAQTRCRAHKAEAGHARTPALHAGINAHQQPLWCGTLQPPACTCRLPLTAYVTRPQSSAPYPTAAEVMVPGATMSGFTR